MNWPHVNWLDFWLGVAFGLCAGMWLVAFVREARDKNQYMRGYRDGGRPLRVSKEVDRALSQDDAGGSRILAGPGSMGTAARSGRPAADKR